MKNKNPLHLNDEDWQILKDILRQYPKATFYAYGSRVKDTHVKFSDIDLCVMGKVDLDELKDRLRESDLTIKVDLKKREEFSSNFFELIEKDLIRLDLNN